MRLFKSRLARFRRSERGSMSVEAVLIFPILLWAYAAMFIYWDAYKTKNLNLKATYTLADLISRERWPITENFVDGMNEVYEFLIRRNEGNDIRVSIVTYVEHPINPALDPILELNCSIATGSLSEYADAEPFANNLPSLTLGDQLIVVETQMTWSPPFSFGLERVGLDTQPFGDFIFTTKRFPGRLCCDLNANDDCDEDEVAT